MAEVPSNCLRKAAPMPARGRDSAADSPGRAGALPTVDRARPAQKQSTKPRSGHAASWGRALKALAARPTSASSAWRFRVVAKTRYPLQELATIAQPCGYPVDGQVDCLHHALVGIASPVTLQQFDLYMVERIQVGETVLDRARQQRILIEQCLLAGDGEQHINRALPFGTQPRKDSFAQLGVLDKLRVA